MTEFYVGQHVCMLEPFFKIGMDRKPFVRIDKPSDDLAFIRNPRPADGAGWHSLGNHFYGCKHSSLSAARECCSRALAMLGVPAATLLSNRSAAHLGMSSFAAAALDAGAALLLDPTNQKAAFRLAKALSQMPDQASNSGRWRACASATSPRQRSHLSRCSRHRVAPLLRMCSGVRRGRGGRMRQR
jgi:hypothetical protein